MYKVLILGVLFGFLSVFGFAQDGQDTVKNEGIKVEKLTYQQQPGLALAASKIFFSEKRYSISGFGEASFVNYLGPKNSAAGDLELYYTNLYRFATFFGYRITDNIIWNSEAQIEYLHDGNNAGKTEFLFEAFIDFLWKDYLKARVGYFPLPIGYVNNNDEPVMFYSVNRSEVERLITPTTWIEFGSMFYGNISKDLSYALGISQGLNAAEYLSGSWIRQGRVITYGLPKALSFTPQLNYSGIPNTTLSVSGFFGNSGQEQTIAVNGAEREVKAPVRIGTGYAKYELGPWRFVTVGTLGRLGQSDQVFELTLEQTGLGQVMGSQTMGYLFELGYDLLPLLKPNRSHKEGLLYNSEEFKLPIFLRFERLDTHRRFDADLVNPALVVGPGPDLSNSPTSFVHNNLRIWTLGTNFNLKENLVLKANYQFRSNLATGDQVLPEGDRVEFGFGFIF